MVEVQVRHVLDDKGFKLGDFNVSEINEVASIIEEFGAYLPNRENDGEACKYVGAQFVIGDEAQFFEIIVD